MNAQLQHTLKGRDETRQKTHVLTQSERLVLVLVDGLTSLDGLRRKLRGLSERRFKLAIADLTAKGLIDNVPPECTLIEKLNAAEIECFIRQDPLDPVTITALCLSPALTYSAKPNLADNAEVAKTQFDTLSNRSEGVDFYLPLEKQPEGTLEISGWQAGSSSGKLVTANGEADQSTSLDHRMRREKRGRQVQMGYWLLFAGLVCVALLLATLRSH